MRFLEELFCCGHFPHKQQPKFLLIIFFCFKEITEMLEDSTLISYKKNHNYYFFFCNFAITITTSAFEFTAFECPVFFF